MSTVDSRIVTMKFDNASFEKNAATTMKTIEKMKQALSFSGTKNGLSDIQNSAGKFSLGGIGSAVDGISKKFLALSTIAVTALANITNRAIDAGLTMVKSLTVDPILDGLREYETKLNSVQTILSNTQSKGTTLDDVNAALAELNEYADLTIYNFAEMTRNIGTFTAAGVDLDTSVSAIKGIANLAAVSGSSSQQASTAMYQLSQALATGTVKLMDWNSVVNAGMGGEVFQEALKRTARVHGVAVDQIIDKSGSFRDSLSEGWLTADILNETLSQISGDLNRKQLESIGYTKQQIKEIEQLAKTATDAATKVKTGTQLIEVLQEAVGSGWADTWQLIFGDFEEAKELWTGASDVLTEMVEGSADARNNMLKDWKELGGRTALIESVSNAFNALMAIVRPIKEAFRDIFPALTGQRLYEMTVALREFTEGLMIGGETSENLKRTFRGVFAVLSIGWEIIKGVFGVFLDLFGVMNEGSGSFLEFTAGIGDWLVALEKAVKEGEGLEKFFGGLGAVLAIPLKVLGALSKLIWGLFDGFDEGDAQALEDSFGGIGDRMSSILDGAQRLLGGLARFFGEIMAILSPFITAFVSAFAGLGEAVGNALAAGDYSSAFDIINTVLLGGILLLVKKFFTNGLNFDFGGGILENIGESFDALTGSLQAMQTNIQADTLLKIASAVGILTLSVVALAGVDSKKLTKSLTAMTVAFAQLLAAMTILVKISGAAGFVKVPIIAGAMILLAGAILILTLAVRSLAGLNWNELAKGLTGVAGLLVAISAASVPLSANSAGMIRAGTGIAAMAVGLVILAQAVQMFGSMSWSEIGRGLTVMAGALVAIGLAVAGIPLSVVVVGPGLIAFAAALIVIAQAMQSFGSMDWGEIGKGLTALAGALTLIALAVLAIPVSIVIIGPALIAVALALEIIAHALQSFGGMSWEEIGRGMAALGGSLAILAIALTAMSASLTGAAALIVAAGALAILAPVLERLGQMTWGEIVKGLVTLAAAFTVIGLAGLLLGPITPFILLLGIAVASLGVGLAAAGAGALAFATAFSVLATVGAAGAVALGAAFLALINLIPQAMKKIGEGIVEFAKVIGKSGPQFVKAFATLLDSILTAIIKTTPKYGKALSVLIQTGLRVLRSTFPQMVTTGLNLLLALLRGVRNDIPRIVDVVSDIVTRFIRAMGSNAKKFTDAGADAIIDFVNGLADTIREKDDEMRTAGSNLAGAIVSGMVSGLSASSAISRIAGAAASIAQSALDAAKNKLGIKSPSKEFEKLGLWSDEGLAVGLRRNAGMVEDEAENVANTALETLRLSMSRIQDVASNEINMQPVIAPVLDLTNLQKNASAISGLLGTTPISPAGSYNDALMVSEDMAALREQQVDADLRNVQPREVKFEQNNYSPKALSPVEIYRNTRSQLALAEEALH